MGLPAFGRQLSIKARTEKLIARSGRQVLRACAFRIPTCKCWEKDHASYRAAVDGRNLRHT
jgi:hypothetical protein